MEWNILREEFITFTRAEFSTSKVFILKGRINIGKYAKLLNLKQVAILRSY